MTPSTALASATDRANTLGQSSDRQAGTTPRALTSPRLGLMPTVLVNAAGTRPDPAVSVPIAAAASPSETARAEPELEPPPM